MMFGRPSEDSELMLVDFGMSAKFSEFDLRSAVGTPYFMAPEVLNRIYSKECDIWSVGVTIYFLYSLSHPFKGSNLRDLMQKIRSGKFVFKSSSDFPGLWRNSSPEMRDLIK